MDRRNFGKYSFGALLGGLTLTPSKSTPSEKLVYSSDIERHTEDFFDVVGPDFVTEFGFPLPQNCIESRINKTIGLEKDKRINHILDIVKIKSLLISKIRDDLWHCILACGTHHNTIVYDQYAKYGLFTDRLIACIQLVMRRNLKTRMDRIAVSKKYLKIPRSHNYYDDRLIELKDSYQSYLRKELKCMTAQNDKEFVIGLNTSKKNTFVVAQYEPINIYDNGTELIGRTKIGAAVIDNKCVQLGSF